MTLVSDAIGAAFTGRKAITPWAAIRRIVDSQNQSTFADTRKDSRMGWLADLTDASVQEADNEGRRREGYWNRDRRESDCKINGA